MKFFWLLFLFVVMFASCAPQKARVDLIFSDQETVPMMAESVVEVAVLPKDLFFLEIDQLAELCDKIEQEAWRRAFKNLLRDFVRSSIVLQPSSRSAQEEIFHKGSQLTGYCQPVQDEISGKFMHNVHFEATLLPLRRFAGVIDALHGGHAMAGTGSRAYVTLMELADLSAPMPVLIVQRQEGLKPGFVRVIGSGVITQIFGSQGQLEILESTKEIVAGDMFFVLQAKGRFVQNRGMDAPYSPGVWRGIPAVTVQPADGG